MQEISPHNTTLSHIFIMPRIYKKKTDIPIPEPRHRVGPKGVSSGISFRDLPSPSLDEIKKICEHYQIKCAGTYQSLASRYVYQMADEIELLVDALKGGMFPGEESASKVNDRYFDAISDIDDILSKKTRAVRSQDKRNVHFGQRNVHVSRPLTAHSKRGKPRTCETMAGEFRSASSSPTDSKPFSPTLSQGNVDSIRQSERALRRLRDNSSHAQRKTNVSAYLDLESNNEKVLRWLKEDLIQPKSHGDLLARLNLEGQNEEVLRWLKEELKRSQFLIDRSKYMHDAELNNAQNDLRRVKKAAKLLVKAVHRKGKERAAKSEANAEKERLRRLQSQKMIESLIQSHSTQIDLLKKGLQLGSPDSVSDQGRLHPWGYVQDDRTDISLGFTESSDLTSILDDLAEESYRRSKVVENP